MIEILSYGAAVERTPSTAPAFRLTHFHHLTPEENRGRQNIYVMVWDAQGLRLVADGLRIKATGLDMTHYIPLTKPASPIEWGHGDVPMWANNTYSICIVDKANHDSDTVVGLHTRHPDEAKGNNVGHHSFLLEFSLKGQTPPAPDRREQLFEALKKLMDEGHDIVAELEKLG